MNTTANTTRIRWWIAGLMWLAIAINYIDRTVLSAAAPHLIDELKLDPEMMGFIMAAFFWSYSLLQIPAGWFADRFGQKKGLGLAVAWWSIATSMMGVATGFKSLLALRLALGVGEAAAYPSNAGIAARWFPDKERVFQVGTSNEYEQIFKRIIIELQRCQDNYEEMLVLLLRHLLISFHRELTREHILKNEYLDHEMDNAVTFFSENYNQNINIDDYAASRGMSVSWFIRNFKKYTGSTPMQFIVGIRINNAQMLLETTTYSINEISKIVGYDNQLYFSRLFHKLKGYSPREYRKLRNKF